MAKRDLALDLFKSFQTGQTNRKTRKKEVRESTGTTNDPQLLKDLLSNLIAERNWDTGVAEGTLFSMWEKIVGNEISLHAQPISLLDGVLTIQSSSTAWATQLHLIGPDLLETIQRSAPGALVESITVIGPQGPSWKKGIRTIRGARGPRDTYG
ncbi:MAG: DciA family protein [Candidatus Nanopelagicaceae bacterium]|nr:DciA family protein [Candidatus Nanopelagicaceae bacterium]